MLINECKQELNGHIIPFWNKLRDNEYGGFYGQMDNDLNVDKKGTKGVILNSRILWFYSSCYRAEGGEENLSNARHAYEFLRDKCVDRENGGVYWMMNYDGTVNDGMKHTYNQAFAIYALSAYYLASGEKEALELAYELFNTVEEKCTDDVAYMEAFTADWKLTDNDALSENGLMADKTMNTVLHLIEGYTVFYEAAKDERIAERLRFLLDISKNKIFDAVNNKLLVFFDKDMNVIGDIHSYGHDIEATWLIDRACETLGDEKLIKEWREINLKIAEKIYNIAFENGAVNNEREDNKIDRKRVWWVQAESIVGFINAYEHSGDKKYLDTACTVWKWVRDVQVDKRDGSEWWAEVDFEGKPMPKVTMVNEWKCPYHNGRMCLEVMARGVDGQV
ncbi:MAG: AGE family epimerase/isomerase [Oscillospiraceae bacterium]|nr:AGE family epimerase/isomerase [Oscillospiraceae bacterium]